LPSRRRHEVLSAWARADHDAFDMASQVAAICNLFKGLDEAADNEDEICATVALGSGWEAESCEALGIGRRNLFRYLKLYRSYSPDQKALLRRLGLADELVPLERLSALSPLGLLRALAYLENGKAATIAEALALEADAPTASPFNKKTSAFLTFLHAKATARERADLMRQLNEEYLPDGRLRSKAKAN